MPGASYTLLYAVCTHINNTLQRLRVFTTVIRYNIYRGSCATFVAATRLTDRPTGPLLQYVHVNVTTRHHNLEGGGSPSPFQPSPGFILAVILMRKTVKTAVPPYMIRGWSQR